MKPRKTFYFATCFQGLTQRPGSLAPRLKRIFKGIHAHFNFHFPAKPYLSIKMMPTMTTFHSGTDNLHMHNAWLTIGSFDGVHIGHRDLIRQLVDGAHAEGCPAVAMTLYPHPSRVVRGLTTPIYLSTLEERLALLGGLGMDAVIQLRFDHKEAALSAATFMNRVSYHLGLKHLMVGPNFALGHNRKGDVNELMRLGKALGFQLTVITPQVLDGIVISSSQIRAWLGEGDVEIASRALGRPYRVCGQVVHGDGRGGKIGIPTANLDVWQEQMLPAGGVYACWVEVNGKRYQAVTNIGLRPTFLSEHPHITVEANLLDYSGDLYGHHLCLDFIRRIRGESRFDSGDALVKRIHKDITLARRLLV